MTNSVNVEAPTTARRILTADEILDAPDLDEQTIYVEAWGGEVKVRAFSKATQQRLRRDATIVKVGAGGKLEEEIDPSKLERLSFVAGVVEPAFSVDQADRLAEKSAKAFDLVLKAIFALSAITEESTKAAEKSGSN